MDDPNLLYEDLFENLEDGKAIIKTSLYEMEDAMKILTNEAEELKVKLHDLREKNEGLSKQNEVLIRNISCLFKTAQMEIARKDKQIRSLQELSAKSMAFNCPPPLSTSNIRVAGDRDKPYLTAAASQQEDQKGKTGGACTTSGGKGKQGIHGGKHAEHSTTVSRADTEDEEGEVPSHARVTGKQGDRGEFVDMASSRDFKSRKDSNGARNGGYRSRHGDDSVGLQTDYKVDMANTPSASDDMAWKRRRREGGGCRSRGQEYHRGRNEERS